MIQLATLGIASSLGCEQAESGKGPLTAKSSGILRQRLANNAIALDWDKIIFADASMPKNQAAGMLCRRVSEWTQELVSRRQPFVAIGGDHSSAMGIWSGALSALNPDQSLGLIWIDAHLDLHNFISSPSGNIHGMPLAALLGQYDSELEKIYGDGPILDPNKIVLVGARSYESEEAKVLNRLKLRCFDVQTIRKSGGLISVLAAAIGDLLDTTDCFGISIDLDAVDPSDAPAVTTPVAGGFSSHELVDALKQINGNQRLVGIEIAEYAPGLDKQHHTLKLIADIIAAVYGSTATSHRHFRTPPLSPE